jgi:hypothetical protein
VLELTKELDPEAVDSPKKKKSKKEKIKKEKKSKN